MVYFLSVDVNLPPPPSMGAPPPPTCTPSIGPTPPNSSGDAAGIYI